MRDLSDSRGGFGVLIEVRVMLSVVWIVNRSKNWYERGAEVQNFQKIERTV